MTDDRVEGDTERPCSCSQRELPPPVPEMIPYEEPIKEKVHDLVKEEAEQTSVKEVNNDKVLEKQKTPEAPVSETDNVLKEEEVEAESDKKKLKKRKKKQDSGEPEDLNNSHRVFICDEQVKTFQCNTFAKDQLDP